MSTAQSVSSFVVIGEQSLLIQCVDLLLARGHSLQAVVSEDARIGDWCRQRGVRLLKGVDEVLDSVTFECDYLLSVTNLRMLPASLLQRARRLAINFHDGPLPRYAGLNAPVWALINGETDYGISWHVMSADADTGDLLGSRPVAIAPDDTSFTLNARCYEAGLAEFEELLVRLETNSLHAQPQDLSRRSYFGRADRPKAAAILDWCRPAVELERLVRALDFGPYPNPIALPKLALGSKVLLARTAREIAPDPLVPAGTLQAIASDRLTVRCSVGALELTRITDVRGGAIDLSVELATQGLRVGNVLPSLSVENIGILEGIVAQSSRLEQRWLGRLRQFNPAPLPLAGGPGTGFIWRTLAMTAAPDPAILATAVAVTLGRIAQTADVAFSYVPSSAFERPAWVGQFVSDALPIQIPVRAEESIATVQLATGRLIAEAETAGGHSMDLPARDPAVRLATSCFDAPVRLARAPAPTEEFGRRVAAGAVLTLLVPEKGGEIGVLADARHIEAETLDQLLSCVATVIDQAQANGAALVGDVQLLTPNQRAAVARYSGADGDPGLGAATTLCLHQAFELQVARTPDLVACICRNQSLTYLELNGQANQLARHLMQQGVRVGDRVGVMIDRSIEMLVALYAVHKCGAAYVPLDPSYPDTRLTHMIADAAARCVIVQRKHEQLAGPGARIVLEDVRDAVRGLSQDNLAVEVSPTDLAYVIYTSGSTGRPKGVMVEHRNVANFFEGMDRRIDAIPGVWLAVTSISFDISVLELFWTLARGFTILLHAEGRRTSAAARPSRPERPIDFGFFYWNVASEERDDDTDKYRLLLESAKFADEHGFNAVWTPERHFSSFGGLFPNPAVTSAALATITQRVSLRAGSCVAPLHSPIRIAEEWSVIDNLSNGRVGISVAAGWAIPDFVIRPENFANAKQVMFETAETVRRLWRGESIMFDGPKGPVAVRTLPRPVQPELPLWVTTAGNIDTFVQAGCIGANLLTHLLGQTVDEIESKITAYREAWRDAGHPGTGIVTLMLHTLVGPDEAEVEATVKQPLKDYLKSAAFLVKAAAWQFPTFKKLSESQGRTLDEFFTNISDDDMDALLEFAFQRYFHTSGLFGSVERCLSMVAAVQRVGVDEIACLIDFGIDTEVVMRHLPHLDSLRAAAQRPVDDHDGDYTLRSLLTRGDVSHLQCTPSMARMLLADPKARGALKTLRQILVGGEALPPDMAADLAALLPGRVKNMYGPTETTIWSTVGDVAGGPDQGPVSIGRPLARQSVYILDEWGRQLPPGVLGELVVGGDGVTRGYWGQPSLTAERFQPDPFSSSPTARVYRTGDRGRYRTDGEIECLGRVDHQVKIRGHRVEPGEIESAIRAYPGVSEAVVILREDIPGDQRLVAYLRSAGQAPTDSEAIRTSLRSRLPEFMVPSAFVWLSAMPLTPNGKLDRRALPAPTVSGALSTASAAPETAAETMIAEIWQRALGIPSCGTRDNFFDLGGHSLLVVQVLAELRQKSSKPIQMTDLFKYTTVESLARFIEAPDVQGQSGQAAVRAARRRQAMGRRVRN